MSQRIKRVNELLKHEISQLILREIDFPDILVTITDIDTSADLRHTKVKISALPQDKNELAIEIINQNIFRIQQKLNKKLHMKPIPKIRFEIDQVEIKAQRIEELLSKNKS
ncbi:MAG: ribosome-binding factor A [Patescibacteria group bacterium]|nr:ribosome-binding factor A [Patescibacteria group bacterium]